MIELRNIYHEFDKNYILENISYNFDNKKYLITGPSGIGKTTFLNITASLLKPTYGSVHSDRKIGFIFQHFNLLNDFTVKENIELAMRIKNMSGSYGEIIEITGIKNILNKFPNQISGGEKQRVAIARTLADGSNFIIADEPTGNLDPYNVAKIRTLFKLINHELKIGFLISSHDNEWKKSCDEHLEIIDKKLELVP